MVFVNYNNLVSVKQAVIEGILKNVLLLSI